MKKSYAVIAGTPYTLFNILNFIKNTIEKGSTVDLFVHSTLSMDLFISRLVLINKNVKIFNNIYTFKLRTKEISVSYYLYDLCQAALPSQFLKEIIQQPINLERKRYDVITITSGFDVEMALVRVFPKAEQIAIEDGLGSYVGDIVHDHQLNWIWRVFGRRTELIQPKALYVNNVAVCKSTLSNTILPLKKISDFSDSYMEMVNYIFSYTTSELQDNKTIIYLTQPIEELHLIDETPMGDILTILLEKCKEALIIRRHPRDKGVYPSWFEFDEGKTLWELICGKEINDTTCLIGLCSTAQMMPKILFGTEPTIIFLYKMFRWDELGEVYKQFERAENLIRKSYEKKNKIFAPVTSVDFRFCLNQYFDSIHK